jgi:hypothetical protein
MVLARYELLGKLAPMDGPARMRLAHTLEQLEDHVGPLRAGGVLPPCIQEGQASLGGDGVGGAAPVGEALERLHPFRFIML